MSEDWKRIKRIVHSHLYMHRHRIAVQSALEKLDLVVRIESHCILNQIQTLNRKVGGWLEILNEEQAYVVKSHLIEGKSWEQVVVMYNTSNPGNKKNIRMLRYIQETAVSKIAQHAKDSSFLFCDAVKDSAWTHVLANVDVAEQT